MWHFHQPQYVNPATGATSLPWVRLHALKDYYDVAARAGEFENLRLTYNLVPSLTDQLEALAAGRATDPALLLARRDASSLQREEMLAILDLFFSVPYRTLIAPFPRYAALYHKRGHRGSDGGWSEALGRFETRDYRDLAVWFHIAWSGEILKRRAELRELIRKGEDFTEREKSDLLDLQQSFLGGVLPHYRRIADSGRAEFSASPYYHPILPLLCDSDAALEAAPQIAVPRPSFRRPVDAYDQVRRAIDRHKALFGSAPAGMWPSEGSISEAVLRIMGESGIRWAASDDGVLGASLALTGQEGWYGGHHPHDRTCFAYRFAGEGPALFFRERELSDLVGFTYASMPAEEAAEDLVRRLLRIREELGQGSGEAIVPVILDGENAWEYYPDNGEPFMRSLYARLTSTPGLVTETFSGYLDSSPPVRRLERVRSGSWIRSDFTTWIGHPAKNHAWDLLRDARQAFDRATHAIPETDRATAWECLLAAEGSDWFWWYGEEHSSDEDPVFDASFRDLLRSVYQKLGEEPPAALSRPITKGGRRRPFEPPTGAILPVIDGRRTHYFEWLLAGVCESAWGFGTMRPGSRIERAAFGWGDGALYVRVDPFEATAPELLEGGRVEVVITRPIARKVVVGAGADGAGAVVDDSTARCAAGRVLEIAIPLGEPGLREGAVIAFSITYRRDPEYVERLPHEGEIVFAAGSSEDWSV